MARRSGTTLIRFTAPPAHETVQPRIELVQIGYKVNTIEFHISQQLACTWLYAAVRGIARRVHETPQRLARAHFSIKSPRSPPATFHGSPDQRSEIKGQAQAFFSALFSPATSVEMSRRRNTSAAAAAQADSSVQLRWHSVANPDTPSLDIMSSPDPLNDTITADHVPSSNTRRVTRSQRAHKFLSLGPSPRRQAFELDTGNRRSARGGLVVSVEETDEDDYDARADNTLAVATQTPGAGASSTPRPREPTTTTTTTTVPLRYSVEDESSDVLGSTSAAPRPRKTRIRTSNGTPIPKSTTGKRRRDATPPGRRTSGRPQTVDDSMESDSTSDDLTQRSPTPKRRMRSPRSRVAEPSSELGTEPAPAANPVRRIVRSRRQSVASDRSAGREDAADNAAMVIQVPTSEDDLQRDTTITGTLPANRELSTPPADAEPESDIWMTTMSQDATPKASAQPAMKPASQTQEREEERQSSVSFSEVEYGFLAPAASDLSSADDDLPVESTTTRRNDTIARGEDFSMILPDSIPSLRASLRGVAPPPSHDSEIGDETNLIFNSTLLPLRQGEVADREDEGEDDGDDDADTLTGRESENDPAEEKLATPKPLVAEAEPEAELEAQPEASQPQAADPDENGRESGNGAAGDETAAPAPSAADTEPEPELEAQSDQSQAKAPEPAVQLESESANGSDSDGDLEAELARMAEEDNAEFERQVEQEVLKEVEAAAAEKAARESESEPEMTPLRPSSSRPSSAVPRSARLSQSPRQPTNSSPLRYRVFKRYQTGGSSPGSVRAAGSPRQTGESAAGSAQAQESRQDSVMLEAPAAELGSATEVKELEDEQMDEIMGELEASLGRYAMAADAAQPAEDVAITEAHQEAEVAQQAEQQAWSDSLEMADELAGVLESSNLEDDSVMTEAEDNAHEAEEATQETAEEQPLPSDAPAAQSEPRRLPTPDSSPPNSPAPAAPIPTQQEPQMQPLLHTFGQPGPSRQPSSTPRSHPPSAFQQTETAAQRSGSQSKETLRSPISSIAQLMAGRDESAVRQLNLDPPLASLFRVGRILQSVTSDTPSPEAGDRQLGSPFKRFGSKEREGDSLPSQNPRVYRVTKKPPSRVGSFGRLGQLSRSPSETRSPSSEPSTGGDAVAKPPQRSAEQPSVSSPEAILPTSTARGTEPPPATVSQAQASVSPQRSSLVQETAESVEAAPLATASTSFEDEAPRAAQVSTPGRVSANSSLRHSPESDLSWVANEGPISPRLRGDNTLQDVVAASERGADRSGGLVAQSTEEEPVPAPPAEVVDSPPRSPGRTFSVPWSSDTDSDEDIYSAPPKPTQQEPEVESAEDIYSAPVRTRLASIPEQPELKELELQASRRAPTVSPVFSEPDLPVLPRQREPSPEVSEPELPVLPRQREPSPEMSEPELPVLPRPARDDSSDLWDVEAERPSSKRQRNKPFGTSRRKRKAAQAAAGQESRPTKWMRENSQQLPMSGPRRVPGPSQPEQPEQSAQPAQLRLRRPRPPRAPPTPRLLLTPRAPRTPRVSRPWAPLAVEETGPSPRQQDHSRPESEAEEFSLLARQREAGEQQTLTDSAAKASRFDLSEFFSSPISMAGKLAGKFFPKKSNLAEADSPAAAATTTTTGRLFPQLPPMEQVSVPRRENLFAAAEAQSIEQARLNSAAPRPVLVGDSLPGGSRFSETASTPASTTTGSRALQRSDEDRAATPRRPNMFAAAAETPGREQSQQSSSARPRTGLLRFFPGWSQPVRAASLPVPTPVPTPAAAPAPAPAPVPEPSPPRASRSVEEVSARPIGRQVAGSWQNPFINNSRESAEQSLRNMELRRSAERLDEHIRRHGGKRDSALKRRPAGSSTAPGQPSPPSKPFEKAPPRRELTRRDIRRWQRDSACSPASSEDSFRPPLLRTLPPRDASPEKSSMRPATKARTAGRVVEFTSSVMSPADQELARQRRREREAEADEFAEELRMSRSMSLAFDRDDNRREPPLLQQGAGVGGSSSQHGKVNQAPSPSSPEIADVSMQDASPLEVRASQPAATRSLPGEGLSATQWSREHWLLLQRMVRHRRGLPATERFDRHPSRLLGMYVTARGEWLQIEAWHLDCVQAFQVYVDGWQEVDLVRRVFGLIMGERVRAAKRALREQRRRE